VLRLTPAALPLLRGGQTLVLSLPRVKPPREPRSRTRRRRPAAASLPDWFTGGPPERLRGDATSSAGLKDGAPGRLDADADAGAFAEARELLAGTADDGLPEPDAELLERLKELRRRLAGRRHVPAYVVFNDATLVEMAALKPATPDELLQVNGVGQVKLERYGEAFLREIAGGEQGLIA